MQYLLTHTHTHTIKSHPYDYSTIHLYSAKRSWFQRKLSFTFLILNENIIPSALNKKVADAVAKAVADVAIEEGIARIKPE